MKPEQLPLGIGGHQSAAARTDEWLTPPHILDALGPFDLDPCAPIRRPWDTAAHHFTKQDDGLARGWFGRVWLNPPYGRVCAAWLRRMVEHGVGTALIFARTETEMFFESVWSAASGLLFLEGRLHFHYVDGTRAKANSGAPSVLVAYGGQDRDILADCDLPGYFIGLQIPFLPAPARPLTWRELLAGILGARREGMALSTIYALVSGSQKAAQNPNWQAKVRQVLNRGGFERIAPGVYALA